ncbi:hypothetical protein [Paraburkholderia sp. BR10954]|uniref:hypothetical protein n=1 Tax=Paraburkholderia sp. BR10954 TaxID=3236995 RepID=UPI0034D1E001
MTADNICSAQHDVRDGKDPEGPGDIANAVKDLYLLSSAAAQLGGSRFELTDPQWRRLLEGTRRARAVMDQLNAEKENCVFRGLYELVQVCEEILETSRLEGRCPPGLWLRASRIGRQAYECAQTWIPAAGTAEARWR